MKIRLSQLRRLIRETVRQQLLVESTLTDDDMLKVKAVLDNVDYNEGYPISKDHLEKALPVIFKGDAAKVKAVMDMIGEDSGGRDDAFIIRGSQLEKYLSGKGKYTFGDDPNIPRPPRPVDPATAADRKYRLAKIYQAARDEWDAEHGVEA